MLPRRTRRFTSFTATNPLNSLTRFLVSRMYPLLAAVSVCACMGFGFEAAGVHEQMAGSLRRHWLGVKDHRPGFARRYYGSSPTVLAKWLGEPENLGDPGAAERREQRQYRGPRRARCWRARVR